MTEIKKRRLGLAYFSRWITQNRVLGGSFQKILNTLHDRTKNRDFKTDLHFAESSSRPSKAMLKVVKIDIFSQENLQEEREMDQKYSNNSFLKFKCK